jgi:hypothetical protein
VIKWYDLSLIYLVSGIVLVGINRLYRIIPPKTRRGWIMLGVVMAIIVTAWWFLLVLRLGFELNTTQFMHWGVAAIIQHGMTWFLFRPFLKED